MNGYATQIITQPDQIPAGYVPPAAFRGLVPVKWVTVAKAISEAHAHGAIRAAKLVRGLGELRTGRVFVHREDTERFLLDRYAAAPQAVAVPDRIETLAEVRQHVEPAAAAAVAAIDAADVLALRVAIERLTNAVHDLTAAIQLRSEAEAAAAGIEDADAEPAEVA